MALRNERQVAFPDQGGREKLRGNNRLAATERNMRKAQQIELEFIQTCRRAKSDTTDCGP